MRYWDSSALVPLLTDETRTSRYRELAEEDPQIVTWWGSKVECASALARLEREGKLDGEGHRNALRALDALAESWNDVAPTEAVRRGALRALRVHALRSGDAFQLAAALAAAEGGAHTLPFVCADPRLAEAADREGFEVVE